MAATYQPINQPSPNPATASPTGASSLLRGSSPADASAANATTTSTDTGAPRATRMRAAQPGSFAAQANTVFNQAGGHANTALKHGKSALQEFLEHHDLTPQNQLIWHACYASVVAIGLLILPSLVLKYNLPIAVLRGAFGISGKQLSHTLYAFLFGSLGASSFALSGPLWYRARNSLEQIAVARLAIAAVALFMTLFVRIGSDALLLLGLGEFAAGLVLIQTQRLDMDTLMDTAKDGANMAHEHARNLAGQIQEQAIGAQAKLQQTELGAKMQAHPIGQKIIGKPVETPATTNATTESM